MSQKMREEHCNNGCGLVPLERNHYFTGKYMTARDFAGEQEYILGRQRIHNRLLHGWGIVCGLRVLPHPNEDCQNTWVVIKSGVAIDCCGREIYLAEDMTFELPLSEFPPWTDEPVESEKPSTGDEAAYEKTAQKRLSRDRSRREREEERRRRGRGHRNDDDDDDDYDDDDDDDYDDDDDNDHDHDHDHDDGDNGDYHWPENGVLICLHYDEEKIEHVPALHASDNCDPAHHEPNRIREVARIKAIRLDKLDPRCWRQHDGAWHSPCKDDCDEPLPGPGGACLEPDCPCGDCVPLALLVQTGWDAEKETPIFEIDMRGRRHLPTPPHYLTRIIGINWPHGGEVSLHELHDDMDGKLKIRFNRKLLEAEGMKSGINRFTFQVEYGDVQKVLEFLPTRNKSGPWLEDDGCTAVFDIHSDYIDSHRNNIAGSDIYITLRCDFILDCHETPVDGNHLRGRLPSGDGRPGGAFKSWFRVIHGHHGHHGHHHKEND